MNAIQWMSTICCLPLVYIMGSSFIILHNAFIFNIFIYHVLHNENGPVQCLQNMLNEGHQTKDTSNWDGFWQCLTRQPRNASLLRCRLLFEKHPGNVLTAEGAVKLLRYSHGMFPKMHTSLYISTQKYWKDAASLPVWHLHHQILPSDCWIAKL